MPTDPTWVPLADFAAGYEADLAASLLRSAGIPVLIRGPEIGIFGPGFAGATSRGVTLLVPAECVEEAREVLEEGE